MDIILSNKAHREEIPEVLLLYEKEEVRACFFVFMYERARSFGG